MPLVGPFVIACGALLGVRWSNRNATRRHEEQLTTEGERHQERLEAEGERHSERLAFEREMHREQLEHDRVVRAREETRRSVDDATTALTNAMDGLTEYAVERATLDDLATEQRRLDTPEEREALQWNWNERLSRMTQSQTEKGSLVDALQPAQVRLRLRFPEAHPVYRNYALVCAAVQVAFAVIVLSGTGIRSAQELEEEQRAMAEVGQRLPLYIAAVRKWSEETPPAPDQALAA